MKEFDFISVLKSKRELPDNTEFKRENIQHIVDFMLVWNYFESLLNNDAKFSNIEFGVKKGTIESKTKKRIEELYGIIKQKKIRKITNSDSIAIDDFMRPNTYITFDFYNHNKNSIFKDYQNSLNFIEKEIENENISEKNKLLILLYLSKIIRNNMFHGLKVLPEFWLQKDLILIFAEALKIFSFDIELYHEFLNSDVL